MIKKLSILVTVFYINLSIASDDTSLEFVNKVNTVSDSIVEIIDPPGASALGIMVDTLSSLKELKKQNKGSIENITALINIKFLPNIDIKTAVKLTLQNHWDGISTHDRIIFQKYISQSLVRDYAGILATYENLESINIAVDPNVKRRDNKAIVKLNITFNDNPKVFVVSMKMIRSGRWRIYDVVFSGVSLMKTYRSQFDSYISRRGFDALLEKISTKVN
jgi:phospholipid transport system substrate-binding protein